MRSGEIYSVQKGIHATVRWPAEILFGGPCGARFVLNVCEIYRTSGIDGINQTEERR